MRIVVIGSHTIIGSRLVARLVEAQHDVIGASPATGVNTVSGDGLPEVFEGADVVVDVAGPPVQRTWSNSTWVSSSNVAAAEGAAGISHHVVLSEVGTELLQSSEHFQARLAMESFVASSGIPYSIVRSTPCFELLKSLAVSRVGEQTVRISPARTRPIAADDIAAALSKIAVEPPSGQIFELSGPEEFRLSDLVSRALETFDERLVVADPHAQYFGAHLDDQSLLPLGRARIGATKFESWLRHRPEDTSGAFGRGAP